MHTGTDKPHQELSAFVELLYQSGIQKKYIAHEIGIVKSDTTDLSKLCDGSLQTHNGVPVLKYLERIKSHKEFKKVIDEASFDYATYDLLFFLYYWSSDDRPEVALLEINERKMEKSMFHYLDRNDQTLFRVDKSKFVKSFEYKGKQTLEIQLKNQQSDISTFIMATIGTSEMEKIKLVYCSICGALSGNNNNIFAAIGILERVQKNDFIYYLNVLNTHGISPTIKNALYRRRLDVTGAERDVYKSYEDINRKQRIATQPYVGFWIGYYPRQEIGDKGGIAKVIMEVRQDSTVSVYFRSMEGMTYPADYEGILYFPHAKQKSIIVGRLEPYKKSHRIRYILEYENGCLAGSMSGWQEKTGAVNFSRAMYFERLDTKEFTGLSENEKLASLISKHKPNGYDRSQLDDFKMIIKKLKIIERKVIDIVQVCVGRTPKKVPKEQMKLDL